MLTVMARLGRLFAPAAPRTHRDPVQHLFERAGARAGRNPAQASELRRAGMAWLRVVR